MDIEQINTDDAMDVDTPAAPSSEIRMTRTRLPYDPYGFDNRFGGSAFVATADADPVSYRQALSSADAFRWQEAIDKELNSHASNGTWEIVSKPKNRKTISSKRVFKKKFLPTGQIDKYKARLVARGFTQQHGIDYNETFAPTLRYESLGILFSLAVRYKLRLWLLDVITAYLNGDIDADLYMEFPQGMTRTRQNNGKVLRIIWTETVRPNLERDVQEGDKSSRLPANNSRSVYFQEVGQDVCLIALYVDDIIIASNKSKIYREVKEIITKAFKVTDAGLLTAVPGIRITQDRDVGILAMDQSNYIENLLEKHGMTNCNPVSTPIDGYSGILAASDDEQRANQKAYQQLVGELMFLNMATRFDLSFAVSKLSQFCQDPTIRHMNALTRVLKYLRATSNLGLIFSAAATKIEHFTDAAFADNKDDRRSTHGYIMKNSGAACVWYSRKQRSVVTSTTEAEYIALAEGCKSAIWSTRWIAEAGFPEDGPITLLGDSNGSLTLARNPDQHARTKHIDVQYHFVREKVAEGLVRVAYVSTKAQLADIMTKPLARQTFEAMRLSLGLQPIVLAAQGVADVAVKRIKRECCGRGLAKSGGSEP